MKEWKGLVAFISCIERPLLLFIMKRALRRDVVDLHKVALQEGGLVNIDGDMVEFLVTQRKQPNYFQTCGGFCEVC